MNIGIDMDSVIAEIMEPIDLFHNTVYKTDLKLDDHIEYDLSDIWNCTAAEVINRINEFYDSEFFSATKPVSGSVEGIALLARKHRLILITSRPTRLEKKSKEWLESYFPGKFKLICHTNQVSHHHEKKIKKSEICRAQKVQVMIEDHLEYALDCARSGVRVLLFDMPWNRDVELPKGIERVYSWREITQKV